MSSAAAVCKLHAIAPLLLLVLLFGGVAVQLQVKTALLAGDDDRNNYINVTHEVPNNIQPVKISTKDEQAEECLSPLQNLSRGAFVQCRKSTSNECLTASDFWESQCYLNMTESVVFYHLGKGGGGTIFLSIVENGIVVERDHPRPKHDDELQNGTLQTLITNIRDPTDRFASAFNWRSLLFCQRDGETRKKYPTEIEATDRRRYQPHLHPQEFCYDETLFPIESNIVQRLYNDDINLLAESLCEESSNVAQAIEHTKLITHAKLSLAGWLQFLVNTNLSSIDTHHGLTKFMAITFDERNGLNSSLLEHSNEAVQQLYYDHGVDEKTLDALMKSKPTRTKRVSEMMAHSSHNSSKKNVLGAVGACCLTRFLEDDYRLIQSMLGDDNTSKAIQSLEHVHPIISKGCEWGSPMRRQLCRADLQSILHRRAKFLDRSLGTCRDVVSLTSKPEH